jgi:hypothetical protein
VARLGINDMIGLVQTNQCLCELLLGFRKDPTTLSYLTVSPRAGVFNDLDVGHPSDFLGSSNSNRKLGFAPSINFLVVQGMGFVTGLYNLP